MVKTWKQVFAVDSLTTTVTRIRRRGALGAGLRKRLRPRRVGAEGAIASPNARLMRAAGPYQSQDLHVRVKACITTPAAAVDQEGWGGGAGRGAGAGGVLPLGRACWSVPVRAAARLLGSACSSKGVRASRCAWDASAVPEMCMPSWQMLAVAPARAVRCAFTKIGALRGEVRAPANPGDKPCCTAAVGQGRAGPALAGPRGSCRSAHALPAGPAVVGPPVEHWHSSTHRHRAQATKSGCKELGCSYDQAVLGLIWPVRWLDLCAAASPDSVYSLNACDQKGPYGLPSLSL